MAEQVLTKFYYRARDKKGLSVRGDVQAIDQRAALVAIAELNLIPIEVGESYWYKFIDQISSLKAVFARQVPRKDILIFIQQLHTIYAVGIPILRGLEIIQTQTEHKYLKLAIAQMIADISAGQTLSSAAEKSPAIFNSVFINLIKAGEISGNLEEILDRIYLIVEAQEENAAKVKSALFYPKIVIGFMALVFVFVVNFIIPKLKDFLDRLGADLPAMTKVLLAVSDFFVSYSVIIFILGVASYVGFRAFTNTQRGKLLWDRFLLKLPLVGNLLLMIEMNSFCIVLELLIRSGVDIITALNIIKGTTESAVIVQDIEGCRREVESGGSISKGLSQGEAIPPMVYNLIAVGEEAGALEKALNRIAKFYKLQIDYKVSTLAKALEPLLLLIIFGMVLVLALGVFMPIWSMSSSIKK